MWPAIKDILESMGEVVDTLKEGAFTKITPGQCLHSSRILYTRTLYVKICIRDGGFALGREI